MLVIRQAQLSALSEQPRQRFEARLQEHLTSVFPEQCAEQGPAAVRALVVEGHRRAREYGLRSEWCITLFVDLLVGLGSDFDSRSEFLWLKATLEDTALPERGRMTRIYRLLPQKLERLRRAARAKEA